MSTENVADRAFWTQVLRAIWIVLDAICARHGLDIQESLEKRLRQ